MLIDFFFDLRVQIPPGQSLTHTIFYNNKDNEINQSPPYYHLESLLNRTILFCFIY